LPGLETFSVRRLEIELGVALKVVLVVRRNQWKPNKNQFNLSHGGKAGGS
jgi:hypothetical protein